MNTQREPSETLPPRATEFEAEVAELRRDMNNRFMALLNKITAIHMELVAMDDRNRDALKHKLK